MGELFLGTNASLWYFPERRLTAVLQGAAAILLVGFLFYPVWKSSSPRHQRRILWIITGMLGSLLPLSARPPSSHVMLIPLIGGSVLVGYILYYWWGQIKKPFSFRNVLALDDRVYRFLLWREGRLHFQEPPPIGQSILISD